METENASPSNKLTIQYSPVRIDMLTEIAAGNMCIIWPDSRKMIFYYLITREYRDNFNIFWKDVIDEFWKESANINFVAAKEQVETRRVQKFVEGFIETNYAFMVNNFEYFSWATDCAFIFYTNEEGKKNCYKYLLKNHPSGDITYVNGCIGMMNFIGDQSVDIAKLNTK
jgi:hypothetical protein